MTRRRTPTEPPAVEGARWLYVGRDKRRKPQWALVDADVYDRIAVLRWNLKIPEKRAGKVHTYYARTTINSFTIYLHRWLWLQVWELPLPSGYRVDHVDGNGLDCRRVKLRAADEFENNRNQRPKRGARSRYRGVDFVERRPRRPWRARIVVGQGRGARRQEIGHFATEIEAASAYDVHALMRFGEFARLNYAPAHTLTDLPPLSRDEYEHIAAIAGLMLPEDQQVWTAAQQHVLRSATHSGEFSGPAAAVVLVHVLQNV